MKFPHEITDLNKDENKTLMSHFTGERTGFVQVGPQKYLMSTKYRQFAEEFYSFEPRFDDVWILTHPRSGTTVMQEMLWLLTHDFDYETAKNSSLLDRCPYLEFKILVHDEVLDEVLKKEMTDEERKKIAYNYSRCNIPFLNSIPSRRVVKSHLPLSLLNPNLLDTCKVVYVTRNPKDLAVSYFHHNRHSAILGYKGDFPTFWDYFKRNLVRYGPSWQHLREAWEQRDHPNMLFLFYEDLVKDVENAICKVAQHLGKNITRDQVSGVANYLNIDHFRKALSNIAMPKVTVPGEQGFVRKGQNQGWMEYFTPEMNEQADAWIEENLSSIPGFKFPQL